RAAGAYGGQSRQHPGAIPSWPPSKARQHTQHRSGSSPRRPCSPSTGSSSTGRWQTSRILSASSAKCSTGPTRPTREVRRDGEGEDHADDDSEDDLLRLRAAEGVARGLHGGARQTRRQVEEPEEAGRSEGEPPESAGRQAPRGEEGRRVMIL